MNTEGNESQKDQIAAFKVKVAEQTFKTRTLHGSAIHKALSRRLQSDREPGSIAMPNIDCDKTISDLKI